MQVVIVVVTSGMGFGREMRTHNMVPDLRLISSSIFFFLLLLPSRTAINDTNVYVLYAQTDKFNITGASCTDPTTSSTCYAPASTVYVTQTGTTAAGEFFSFLSFLSSFLMSFLFSFLFSFTLFFFSPFP